MNKKFTKLMAAFALLTFLTVPLGMWGQSDYSTNYTGNITLSTSGGTSATNCNVIINNVSYAGIKAGTGSTAGAVKINVPSGTKYLHLHVAGWSSESVTLSVTPSGYSGNINLTSNSGISGNSPFTFSGDAFTNNYYKVITFTNALTSNTTLTFTASSGKRFVVWGVSSEEDGDPTYTVTYDCNGGTSGCPQNVTGIELDEEITLADAPSKTGHAFDGWNDGTSTYAAGDPYTVTGNVTMTAQWTAYTITAQSNNASYGTVSLDGFTITASPASGCRYASPAYSVSPDNSAEVTQSGNTFTVTPTANTTVTINFEEIPTHTATFSVNGTTTSTQVAEGAAITFPADPANIDEMVFMGWTNAAIDGTTDTPPTFVTSATMGNSDVTFYAVFASVTPGTGVSTSMTISATTPGVPSSYGTANTFTEYTLNGKKFKIQQMYKNGAKLQWRAAGNSNGTGTMYNSEALQNLQSIVLNYDSSDNYKNFTVKVGTAENPTNGTSIEPSISGDTYTFDCSNGNYDYFVLTNGINAGYLTSIVINYIVSAPDTYSDYCTTVIIPTVAKPTFSQASGEVVDGTVVTMSCTTEGATIYYSTDDGATWTEGNTYTITENVTLKAKAVNGSDESQVVEATYTVQYILTVNMEHVEYFIFNYHDEDWYDFPVDAEGRPLVHAGENVRVSVAAVDDCYTLQSLSVTFGENTIVPEYLEDEEYSFIMPASSAMLTAATTAKPTHTLAFGTLSHVTLELLAGEESSFVESGDQLCEGIHVSVVATPEEGYVMGSVSVVYGDNQSVEVTTEGINTYSFYMPAGDATITATAEENVAPLGGTITFGSADGSTNINAASVTGNDSMENTWTITTEGTTSFSPNPGYAQVGSSNKPATSITFTTTLPQSVVLTSFEAKFGGNSNTAGNITLKVGETTVGSGSLNGPNDVVVSNTLVASGNTLTVTVTDIARGVKCYYISYEYVEPLHIDGYNGGDGGWYLIASPVTELTPSAANGFITDTYGSNIPDGETGTYDLYYFDQTGGDNGKEWKNYRQHTFNLESGKGYLYASKEGTDLIFTGTAYNGNGVVNLTYSESTSIDDNMRGWNLIGNPFGTTANLPSGLSYYTLNESRTELTPGSATTIGAMKAIFVQATATGQSVTFTKQTRNAGSNAILSLNLSNDSNGLIDRTIVRFDEGNALPKFMLNPNNTKVFIPVESKDYAVVRHEAQGEMPVNFKAAENGTYTLTVNPEGVEMNYLHLIDNMTGADIDLLAATSTGSVATYTFNASTTDYSSRFRLVFAANNEDGVSTGSTAFAFYSNGTWVINNTGEATLQVVDVNGRILSSETVNGSVSKAINAPAGVYMLRLINGNDVKTQKIVVR